MTGQEPKVKILPFLLQDQKLFFRKGAIQTRTWIPHFICVGVTVHAQSVTACHDLDPALQSMPRKTSETCACVPSFLLCRLEPSPDGALAIPTLLWRIHFCSICALEGLRESVQLRERTVDLPQGSVRLSSCRACDGRLLLDFLSADAKRTSVQKESSLCRVLVRIMFC